MSIPSNFFKKYFLGFYKRKFHLTQSPSPIVSAPVHGASAITAAPPPELPLMSYVLEFDTIPTEKPSGPRPGPEFPGPPSPSPQAPEGPRPPMPSPPGKPEAFPPHGPDVIPPMPPERRPTQPPSYMGFEGLDFN
ncbi:hypothetical protein C2S51_013841 [Perilla frutescens var. frutescens]|nr:hypothetical protein C2S51_013841 [Perilla frutescens var. frutescens]